MIKNIIFDMGNVLIAYEPEVYARRFTDTQEDADLIERELFGGSEWRRLDEGTMDEEQVWHSVTARLPRRLHTAVRECLDHWFEEIRGIEGMEELTANLKERGYRLYLCSNASLRFRQYEKSVPGLSHFDGILISAEEKCIKPGQQIYERLFEKFSILPRESYFIDDSLDNIEGARACGMDGFWHPSRDAAVLKEKLEQVLY